MVRNVMIAVVVLILDQWSKWWIVKDMELSQSIPVIDGFFYITSHRNRGAAFGILQNQQWFFILITCIVLAVIVVYLWKLKNDQKWLSFAFSLVLGGAIGNLIDRIRTGEVVDFLHFQFGTYHFPIFNIADSAIVVGVSILIVITLFFPVQEQMEDV
ncbi:signal peptidase II [Hazenella sp. IB182357]|uniref:Lipoprotein signal peptidase n=1 Tax=Polycladospora coralii TaxID=2771432 RepID=A0A926ND99_9BACL|nr:signal peptidase II [Polycladospora coralii]MBD1371343.1 signal peptidase II [Polycladospora coralii]MBS7530311.1 signal peptidase II [Polycladospora coralii]